MKNRCYNKNDVRNYPLYGGRGIKVCDRWMGPKGFWNFVADMGPKPTVSHSLDRVDNDGDYEPSNVRWATKREQNHNTRRSIGIDVEAEAQLHGIHPETIRRRHRAGLSGEDLLYKGRYLSNYRKLSHGTTTMYAGHGCRCSLCRKANSDYQRNRRQLARHPNRTRTNTVIMLK